MTSASEEPLDTPVVFLVFRRPDLTRRVLERIRVVRPKRLFVVADGPRPGVAGEIEMCREVRRVVDEGIDWTCEVVRDYAEGNLGCARRVAGGLDAVFGAVEEAIVIEDDCLPDATFFRFCRGLLEKYRQDERVGQVCGTPLFFRRIERAESYVFSRYGPVWGWASWRRAWSHYDLHLRGWPEFLRSGEAGRLGLSRGERSKRIAIYNRLAAGDLHTWDYQWGFAKLARGLLSVVPAVNLVENIGRDDATHAQRGTPDWPAGAMEFPLRHPTTVVADARFDRAYSSSFAPGLTRRLASRLGWTPAPGGVLQ